MPVTAAAGRSGVCGAQRAGPRRRRARPHRDWRASSTSTTRLAGRRRAARHLRRRARGRAPRPSTALTLGHWPQSIALSTVGGWLACRSAGQYSTRYGKIEDMVVGLDVVLADGRTIRTGGQPRAGRRARPHPALRRQRGHPRRHHRGPPARPPGAARRAAGGLRLRLLRRRPRRLPPHPAAGRHAGGAAPLRRGRVEAHLRHRAAPTCCSSSTRASPRSSTPRWRSSPRSAAGAATLDDGARRAVAGPPQRRDARSRPSSARASWSTPWRSRPRGRACAPSTTAATAALRAVAGTLAAIRPPVPQLHRRRLPLLHLRRPGRQPRTATAIYVAAVGRGHPRRPRRRRRAQPPPRRRAQPGAVRAARRSATAFDVLAAVKAALDPHGILNPGKLGLPSPVRRGRVAPSGAAVKMVP